VDIDVAEVKARMIQRRAELAISQATTARLAHISKSVLEKYEGAGNERIPNTRQLFALAEVYGVSIDWLLGRTEVRGVAGEEPGESVTTASG
jgi:transcriptional regulator with XRE-family HTH domain